MWVEVNHHHLHKSVWHYSLSSLRMESYTWVETGALWDSTCRYQRVSMSDLYGNINLIIVIKYKGKCGFIQYDFKEFSPRTVSFTVATPNLFFPDTSQWYSPLSLRVTLSNLRLLPYNVTRLEYGTVGDSKKMKASWSPASHAMSTDTFLCILIHSDIKFGNSGYKIKFSAGCIVVKGFIKTLCCL